MASAQDFAGTPLCRSHSRAPGAVNIGPQRPVHPAQATDRIPGLRTSTALPRRGPRLYGARDAPTGARRQGHRPIAVRLELPTDPVRGWLRWARMQRHVHALAGNRANDLDEREPDTPATTASPPLADAIDVHAVAVSETQRSLG